MTTFSLRREGFHSHSHLRSSPSLIKQTLQQNNQQTLQHTPKLFSNSMTIMKGLSLNVNPSNADDKNLEYLFEAFGSMISPEDMASAYCQAGYDVNKASEILYAMLGSSSSNDLTGPPASSVGVTVGTVSGGANYENSRTLIIEPVAALSRSKPRTSGVSVGTVSGVIGADYGRFKAKTKTYSEPTKPVKLMSNEIPASQIWVEKPQAVNNASKPVKSVSKGFPASQMWVEKQQPYSKAPTETMNKDTEMFLLQMLGDGFQLDVNVIREVLAGCGYDVQESMEKLMNMSATTKDLVGTTSSTADQTSTGTHQSLETKFEENLQLRNSSRRSDLEKEVLDNLFIVPGISEMKPGTIRPRRQPRTRKYGLVTGPLEDAVIEFKNPIVKKELNGDENAEVEDNYETLRQAVTEHLTTMKQYYVAAAEACAKGNYELSHKLFEQGHFYMAKAREANETSANLLTQTRDDGGVISLNLNAHGPTEAKRLLKIQLKSMSGIPSIRYLKVVVGTNNDKKKTNARKLKISELLEMNTITWTEELDEHDHLIMTIRIDVINPQQLKF
ncbi:hypothetical protein QVD17_30052 [Tagetes erecta]|uniref:DUF1771 domain-containing protein n=1 Tax=Tagetes erecta TaxID=13708 RepID=A0AAD8K2T9_TARER|nr:hypothetical protein QVD17_30052 [Tagetes erecta]